jgi:hypothetical protein
MIAIIILGVLCLGVVSLVLRVVLFISGKSHDGWLGKIALIAGSIGFLPIIALEWAFNLAMAAVLMFILAYSVAPQAVTDFLKP